MTGTLILKTSEGVFLLFVVIFWQFNIRPGWKIASCLIVNAICAQQVFAIGRLTASTPFPKLRKHLALISKRQAFLLRNDDHIPNL
jgi:hypothetical protein